ncbi:hypothetical protein KGQ20_16485 [Catenulispora sp. NF23]|uniref:hypothetical protein n=1 Tax=Catenulispora pinistramenti TaxID=2705254 RepID=UPI001BABDF34|nr:hypothetical protein [Catenulispora pinistramenti]MBS2534369.1 hypothetical protein [Catenulispora pinistramenti]
MTTANVETPGVQPKAPTCFVIGPISDQHAEDDSAAQKVYEESIETFDKVIKPACRKNGIVPLRADEINEPGEITEQICRQLIESDVVIADLSGSNPNVTYELGIRHTIGKLAIHISEKGMSPFDIAGIRTVRFVRSQSGLIEAKRDLVQKLQEGLKGGFRPLTPARILLGLPTDVEAADPHPQSTPDDDPLGVLDAMAEVETHFDSVMTPIAGLTDSVESLTEAAEAIAPMLNEANTDGATIGNRQKVVIRAAELLRPVARQFKEHANEVWNHIEQADKGMTVVLDYVESTPVEQRVPEHLVFLEKISTLAEESRGSIAEFQDVAPALAGLSSFSRVLRGPVNDMYTGLKFLVESAARFEAWEKRAGAILASEQRELPEGGQPADEP